MPVPPHKSAARLFASSCLTVAGLLLGAGGCERDDERADREVEKSLDAAARERGESAVAGFQKGAQEPGASPAATAHAKSLLAQAEVEHARIVLRDVDSNEIAIARLVSEISNIAGQVQANNATIAGYLELAPKTTGNIAKLLQEERGKVEGNGAEAVWDLGERGQLPALSRTTAQAQKFEAEIQGLEGKSKELATKRSAADRKASDLLTQSRRTTGKKSVDLFAQSAGQTKISADLANQMGQLDHQLLRMRQDLALAQAQSKQLETALTGFSSQIEQNQKSQEEIQAAIEQHRAQSNQLVNGAGGAPAGESAGAAATDAETGEATPAAAVEAEAGSPQSAPAEGETDTGDTAEPREAAPAEAEGDAQPAAFQEGPGDAPAEGAPPEAPAPDDGAAPPEGQPPVESDGTPPAEAPAPDAGANGQPAPTAEGAAPTAEGAAPTAEGAAPTADGTAPAVVPSKGPVTLVTNATMAAKANELATLAAQTATRRAQALALLDSAMARYDAAIADANALLTKVNADMRNADLRTMPQQASWKSLAEVYSALKLNLKKADVQHMIAAVHRDAAAGLAGRRQMAAVVNEVLTEAGIQVPAGLADPKVDADFEANRKSAQEAYDATDALLNGVLEGSGGAPTEEEAKRNAQIAKVVAQYGRAQLAQVANDATAAERLLSSARQTVSSGAPIATEQYPLYLRIALGLEAAPELATSRPAPVPEATTLPTEPEPAPEPATAPSPEPEPAPAPPAAPAPSTGPPQGGGMPGSPGSVPPGGPPPGGGMPPGMPGMPGGVPPGGPPPGGGMPPGMPGMPGGVPPGGPPSGGGMPPGMPGMPGGAPPGGPPGGGMPPGMPGMPGGGMPPGGPGAGPPQGMPGQPGQQAPGGSKSGKGNKSGKSKKGKQSGGA